MNTTLHAQPYDITATGFYFSTGQEFDEKVSKLTNDFGDPVEEFEIQFIDGEGIDCALSAAIGLSQGNFRDFLKCVEDWEHWAKVNVIIAVGERGEAFDPEINPERYNIDVYYVDTLRDLAEGFVAEGLYGDIPNSLQFYIDYDAIARELAMEYSETVIAGDHLIYRAS